MTKELKIVVNKIKKDKDVLAVMLYGSYLRNKKYARDIDICVILSKKMQTKEMSRKRMKYLSQANDKIDIQIFQLLPLYIRIRILKEGKILFSRNRKKVYEKAYEAIKEYNLFEKYYLDYIEAAA